MEKEASSTGYVINEVTLTIEKGEIVVIDGLVVVFANGYHYWDSDIYDTEIEAYVGLLEFINKSIKYHQGEIDELVAGKKMVKEMMNTRPSKGLLVVDIDGEELELKPNEFLEELLND